MDDAMADKAPGTETPTGSAQIFTALAKAQAEFPVIPKSKKGHGYMYAPLDSIQRAIRPILAKNGMGFYQTPSAGEMVTVVFHSSGEFIETRFPMREIEGRMNAMQKEGATSTYAARYGLCLALGISGDEDTDASEKGSAGPVVTEGFTDPTNDDMNIGVRGANVNHDARPADKAKAYSYGIEKGFTDAKTVKGLAGVWTKNEKVIDRLGASYPDLYANLTDAYEARRTALSEDAEEEKT